MPRITSKGQVTMPLAIRDRFGLHPEAEVEFETVDNTVRLRKIRGRNARGRTLVARPTGCAACLCPGRRDFSRASASHATAGRAAPGGRPCRTSISALTPWSRV